MNNYKKILVINLLFMSSVYAESYAYMSTTELQVEVEKRSISGTLPFEMGLELIKRWKNKK